MKFNYNERVNSAPVDDRTFGPIPAGQYTAYISESEVKANKAGTGELIELTFVITGPTHAGRKVFVSENVRHPNAQAEEIGLRNVRSIRDAVGLTQILDTTDLHNKPMTIKVKIEPGRNKVEGQPEKGKYDDRNAISYYKKLEAGAPAATGFTPPSSAASAAPAATETAPAAAAPAARGGPPWARRRDAGAQA